MLAAKQAAEAATAAAEAATEAAAAAAARYRLLADNSTDMIVRVGLDGVRRYVSPASMSLYGYTPEEFIGTNALDAVHPDDRERLLALLDRLRQGEQSASVEMRARCKDGRYIWV